MAVAYEVGDHYHMVTEDGRKFCAIITSIDDKRQADDGGWSYSFKAQGRHELNRDCEWAIEAEKRMLELGWAWMDQ